MCPASVFLSHRPHLSMCIYKNSLSDQILLHTVIVTLRLSTHSSRTLSEIWVGKRLTPPRFLLLILSSCTGETPHETQVLTPQAAGGVKKPARALLFTCPNLFFFSFLDHTSLSICGSHPSFSSPSLVVLTYACSPH